MGKAEIKKLFFRAKIIFAIWILFLSFFLPAILHAHDNIQVHPYITEQAFYVWPNDTSHEINVYLGRGLRYADCGVNIFCVNEMCGISGDGTSITEGSIEEDYYDPVSAFCNIDITLGYGFAHHFYDPDIPPPNNGLNDEIGALTYAQIYWDLAVDFYSSVTTRGLAYWYLGRMAHLLADTSVPAHVHRDSHAFSGLDGKDSYEVYMASAPNYRQWNSSKVNDLPKIHEDWTMDDLFYELAQRAQYFPSDDYVGNTDNLGIDTTTWPDTTEVSIYPDTSGWRIIVPYSFGGDNYISETNLKKTGDYLMPLAIQYTSHFINFSGMSFMRISMGLIILMS